MTAGSARNSICVTRPSTTVKSNATLAVPTGFTGPTDSVTYTVTLRSWDGGSLFTFANPSISLGNSSPQRK